MLPSVGVSVAMLELDLMASRKCRSSYVDVRTETRTPPSFET